MNWFKNLKIRMKMIVSFGLVITLMVGLSVFAVIEIKSIDDDFSYVVDYPIKEELLLRDFRSELRELRRNSSAIVMFITAGDTERINNSAQGGTAAYNECLRLLDNFDALVKSSPRTTDEQKSNMLAYTAELRRNMSIYKTDIFDPVVASARSGDYDGAMGYFLGAANIITELTNGSNTLVEIVDNIANTSTSATKARADFVTLLVMAVSVAVALIALLAALYVAKLFGEVRYMAMAVHHLGTKGSLEFDAEILKSAERCSTWQDEIGDCARAFGTLIQHLSNIEKNLIQISEGNLAVDVDVMSERDNIGQSLLKAVNSFNEIFENINASSVQVSTGSKQVADGAQSLAQGATEQAASIEELSSSVTEINNMAKENTQSATEALNEVQQAGQLMSVCIEQMNQMLAAMRDIDEKSKSIAKTTKVIDDIAFQTNILALNAAVEAARAGQHGKGFAVVAEEVRNLASKSAEAAKETGYLIESSSQSVAEGDRIVKQVNGSLQQVAEIAQKQAATIANIQSSSAQQSGAIEQINIGIDQVAQVVQQNSATAEESAAASEEMSSQSSMLQELISQFRLKDKNMTYHSLPSNGHSTQKRLIIPKRNSLALTGSSNSEYGKY